MTAMATNNPLAAIVSHLPRLSRISDYVSHYAALDPDRDAAWEGEDILSYAELERQVNEAAAKLVAAGVGRGDRVAMIAVPSIDFYILFLACASIGAIWMGVNPRYQPDEILYCLKDAQPCLFFIPVEAGGHNFEPLVQEISGRTTVPIMIYGAGDSDQGRKGWSLFGQADASQVDQAKASVNCDDPALLVYTSGTSGRPKGALLSHYGLVRAACDRAEIWWHGPFRSLANLPVNHIGGVGDIVCTTLVSGGMPAFMGRFSAEDIPAFIDKLRLTFLYQIPTQLQMMMATPAAATANLSSLKAVVWSGSRAPMPLIEQLGRRFPAIIATDYSMTESIGAISIAPFGASIDVLSGSAGWPNARREVRLAEDGEILVRDIGIMSGYLGRPEATAEAIDAEGWLHTNDVGEFRPDGTLAIIGRKSDMFKSGGYNIYPREIELVLEKHPAVEAAAVLSRSDPLYHEVGHAFVATKQDVLIDEDQLKLWCKNHLANYKIPKFISVQISLPMLPIGKVDKAQLRDSIKDPV